MIYLTKGHTSSFKYSHLNIKKKKFELVQKFLIGSVKGFIALNVVESFSLIIRRRPTHLKHVNHESI